MAQEYKPPEVNYAEDMKRHSTQDVLAFAMVRADDVKDFPNLKRLRFLAIEEMKRRALMDTIADEKIAVTCESNPK